MSQRMTSFEQPEAQPSFVQIVERLCEVSVRKPHDPFRDIAWDAHDTAIDPRDPRFRLRPNEPLGATAWYAALPVDEQARLGLALLCQSMEFGIALENTLSRGLLTFVHARHERSAVARYALHEVIEESRHSLMFRTFVDRSGCPPVRLGRVDTWLSFRIAELAPWFPELFFVWVLAGEIFVDDDNRRQLKHRSELHPLVAQILQIHVTEEARHMRFADRYIAEHFAIVSEPGKALVRAAAPTILRENARVMLQPCAATVKRFGIPPSVLREAYGLGTAHQARVDAVAAPVLALLREPPRLAASAANKPTASPITTAATPPAA
ncbi:MAG TPA: diiron oxygenase [Polyangiales bacterium]|nr:diiron oxygenase [Polyangiales bacterium]